MYPIGDILSKTVFWKTTNHVLGINILNYKSVDDFYRSKNEYSNVFNCYTLTKKQTQHRIFFFFSRKNYFFFSSKKSLVKNEVTICFEGSLTTGLPLVGTFSSKSHTKTRKTTMLLIKCVDMLFSTFCKSLEKKTVANNIVQIDEMAHMVLVNK